MIMLKLSAFLDIKRSTFIYNWFSLEAVKFLHSRSFSNLIVLHK